MNDVAVIAPVRKTVHVKAPIAHAFEVFTSGLTRWWPHDHGVGKKPIQTVLRERRRPDSQLGPAAPPGDDLAGQCPMEAGPRDEIGSRRALCRRWGRRHAC